MKFKKIKILLLLVSIMCFVTGCSNNNGSAESVAVAMVERLSNDNYDGIGKLFYCGENTYFDEEVFKELVEEKGLNISGNKKIDLVEIGSEITNEDGYIHSKVKIEIDDNKTFNLDTIEVDGKWYVYDETFYDQGILIIVPDGSTIKINNKKVDSSLFKEADLNLTLVHPSSTKKSISVPAIPTKAYTLGKVLKGSYDITVEGNKTIKDVIYSYSNNGKIKSSNYTYQLMNNNIVYNFDKTEKNDDLYLADSTLVSNVEKFVKSYYDDFVSVLTNDSGFDTMKKYFDSNSNLFDSVKNTYNNTSMYMYTKSNPYKYTYIDSYYYYGNYINKETSVKKVYYADDNTILVAVNVNLEYKYYTNSYTSGKSYNKNIYSLMHLKKVDDSFAIVNAKDLIYS